MNDQSIQTVDSMGMSQQTETSSSALAMAERQKAIVAGKFIKAMQNPRDLMTTRDRLLKDARRPTFARQAIYRVPIGDGIEGPSIRFAEAAIAALKNIDVDVSTVSDTREKEVLMVAVCDLESNVTYSTQVVVTKTVERKKLRKGQTCVSERVNSWGDRLFIVAATDDEVLNKRNALISKALRTQGIRHLPGDIKDEALELCRATMADEHARDPDAARKEILDAFSGLGVPVAQLADYVGHTVDTLSPAEMIDLRAVYAAVREGTVTWHDVLQARLDERGAEITEEGKPAPKTAAQKRTEEILAGKRKVQKERAKPKSASKPKNEAPAEEKPPAPDNERAATNPDDPDSYG